MSKRRKKCIKIQTPQTWEIQILLHCIMATIVVLMMCLCSKTEHASFKHGASPYISLLPLLLISLSCNISRSVTAVQIENPLMNQYLLQAAKWRVISHQSSMFSPETSTLSHKIWIKQMKWSTLCQKIPKHTLKPNAFYLNWKLAQITGDLLIHQWQ